MKRIFNFHGPKKTIIYILLIVCILFSFQRMTIASSMSNDRTCNFIPDQFSAQYGLQPNGINSARMLLNHLFGNWRKFCKYNQKDIAKRMNFLVYNYCSAPDAANPIVNDLNGLFNKCVTACGGRVYVLQGLLAVYGINTRIENIYNIPLQFNHTALNADFPSQSGFLDPTFGAFFTKDGNIDSYPLSLENVRFLFSSDDQLVHYTFQANRDTKLSDAYTQNLTTLYSSHRFESKGMYLSSYLNAETVSSPDSKNILYLTANLKLVENAGALGCIHATSINKADTCLLRQLGDMYQSNVLNSISLDISNLGYSHHQMVITVFNLSGLSSNNIYKANFLINNPYKINLVLNISSVGRGINLSPNSSIIILKPGLWTYSVFFKSSQPNSSITLSPIPGAAWQASFLALSITSDKVLYTPSTFQRFLSGFVYFYTDFAHIT